MPYRLATPHCKLLAERPLLKVKTGWMMGIEPTNAGATIRCVSHFTTSTIFKKTMCQEGLEPPTLGLEGRCSIQLSYWHILERVMGIEPT